MNGQLACVQLACVQLAHVACVQLVWAALVASWKLDNNVMKSIISLRSGGDFQPIGHVLKMRYFNNMTSGNCDLSIEHHSAFITL